MRKRNSTKDMAATIIALWKAELPWADKESSFSPECRRAMRSTPGQAPPMPTEHTLWHYVWGGSRVGLNVTRMWRRVQHYMLLHHILYSMQRSKISDDYGEQENHSSHLEILNDPRLSSQEELCVHFPWRNGYNWSLFESWPCLHFFKSSESVAIILANEEWLKRYKHLSSHLSGSLLAGCSEVGKCQLCQQGRQPFLCFCSGALRSCGCFLHGYKVALRASSNTSPISNIQNEKQGGGQIKSFPLYHPLFYKGRKFFPEAFLHHWLELP